MNLKVVSMRKASIGLFLLLGLLAGCSGPTPEERQLIGLWKIADVESVADRVSGDDEIGAEAKMSVEFQTGGRLITRTKMGSIDSTKNGTWHFVRFDPASKKMMIECNLQTQVTKCEVEFAGPDQIKWIPPNMAGTSKRISFERAK